MEDLKIGFYDTEWTPQISYTWSQRPKYLPNEMHVEDARMLCYGWRWHGTKKVITQDERGGTIGLLTGLRDLMSEADVIVGYNSVLFDNRKVNGLFMTHGIDPPAPYKDIDLYRVIKQNASFYSHKLDFIAEQLLGRRKTDTGGFQLWKDVMAGDPKAWNKMLKNQRQDVNLVNDLFKHVLPWINMPHPVKAGKGRCRNCGGYDLRSRGTALTLNGSYQRLRCHDCGKWQRGTTRSAATKMRNIA